jgi:hypothetical protein
MAEAGISVFPQCRVSTANLIVGCEGCSLSYTAMAQGTKMEILHGRKGMKRVGFPIFAMWLGALLVGIVPPDTQLTPRPKEIQAWDSLDSDRKRVYAQ